MTAGKIAAMFAHHRFIAVRKFSNEAIGRRNPCGLFNLLLSGFRCTERNIGCHCVAEQETLLEHNTHGPADIIKVQIANVGAVQKNAARMDIIKSLQQTEHRCLARPGRSRDTDALARVHRQTNVFEDRLIFVIFETNMLKLNGMLDGGQTHRIRAAGDQHRRIQHLEDSFSARKTGLNAVYHVRDMSHLIGKLMQQICEDEQAGSQSQLAANHQHASITNQHQHVELREQTHGGLKG